MTDSKHCQLIEAGLKLYPELGYRKLSVRTICAEAGLSTGMFHHVFKNKDEYINEILQIKYTETFGKINLQFSAEIAPIESLRQVVWDLAICIREQLPWVQRVFADSADAAEVVDVFLRIHFGRISEGMLPLLSECIKEDNPSLATQIEYLAFLEGAIFSPMIFANRVTRMQLLSDTLKVQLPRIFEDGAITRRIDWCFSVLFPHLSSLESL